MDSGGGGAVSISFHLKQCTVFHHKFGCYAIDVRFSGESRRSPTINILKERVKLDMQIDMVDVTGDSQDLIVSLYNQTLMKGKQVDILVSQQSLPLSGFSKSAAASQQDQLLTFSQESKSIIIAEVKFAMKVNDTREMVKKEEIVLPKKRDFMRLFVEGLAVKFMPEVIEREKLRVAEEERLAQIRAGELEVKRKKQEEDERRKQEVIKRQEELAAQRRAQQDKERKERERIREAMEEKVRQDEINAKIREEHLRQKRIEEERQRKQKSAAMAVQIAEERRRKLSEIRRRQSAVKQVADHLHHRTTTADEEQGGGGNGDVDDNDLKLYEDDAFEDEDDTTTQAMSKPILPVALTKRDFLPIFRRGLCGWLERIIQQLSPLWDTRNNTYSTRFWIFGDETYPYAMNISPDSREAKRISIGCSSLAMYRYASAVGLPNGWLFICGGVNSKLNNIVPFAQVFDPYNGVAYQLASMYSARYTHSSAYYDGYVYVIGGRTYGTGEQSILNTFERFCLKTGTWQRLARIADARCTTTMIGINGSIYLFGGYSPRGRMSTIERYEISTNTWYMLDVRLPFEVEAGIVFSASNATQSLRRNSSAGDLNSSSFIKQSAGMSDEVPEVYFMYGRSNKTKNTSILKIQLSDRRNVINDDEYNNNDTTSAATTARTQFVEVVGKVSKTRVLPGFFLSDDRSRLFVIGGDDSNECEVFSLPNFEVLTTWKTEAEVIPSDLKMFCSALSARSTGSLSRTMTLVKWLKYPQPAPTAKSSSKQQVVKSTIEVHRCATNSNATMELTNKFDVQTASVYDQMAKLLVDQHHLFCFGGIDAANHMPSRSSFMLHIPTGQKYPREPCLFATVNPIVIAVSKSFVYSFGGNTTSQNSAATGQQLLTSSSMRFHILSNQWERICEPPIALNTNGGAAFTLDGCLVLISYKSTAILYYEIATNRFRESYPTMPGEVAASWRYAVHFKPKRSISKAQPKYVGLLTETYQLIGVLDLTTGLLNKVLDSKLREQFPSIRNQEEVVFTQNDEFITYTFKDRVEVYRAEMSTQSNGLVQLASVKTYSLQSTTTTTMTTKGTTMNNSIIEAAFLTRKEEVDLPCLEGIEQQQNQHQILRQLLVLEQPHGSLSKRLVSICPTTAAEKPIIGESAASSWSEKLQGIPLKSAFARDSKTNKVYSTGGLDPSLFYNEEQYSPVASVIEIDYKNSTIMRLPDMLTPRWGHTAIVFDKYLYMIGGFTVTSTSSSSSSKLVEKQVVKSNSAIKQSDSQAGQRSASTSKHNAQSSPMITNPLRGVQTQSQQSINRKSQESLDRLDKITATRHANSQVLIAIQSELANKKRSSQLQLNQSVVLSTQNTNSTSAHSLKSIPSMSAKGQSQSQQASLQNIQSRNSLISSSGAIPPAYVLKKIDRINLVTQEVESVADILVCVAHAGSCCDVLNDSIYVIGGVSSLANGVFQTFQQPIQKYDIQNNTWTVLSELRLVQPLHSVSCAAIGSTQLVIFGGVNRNGNYSLDILSADLMQGQNSSSCNSSRVRKAGELLLQHVSQQVVFESARRLLLIDGQNAQCVMNIGDCMDGGSRSESSHIRVKEIAGFSDLSKQRDVLIAMSDSDTESFSKQKQESLLLLGNERNRVGFAVNLRTLKAKSIELGQHMQLLSSSSSAYSEEDNDVIVTGGMDFDNQAISAQMQWIKNKQQQKELLLPRFLHASVVWKGKLYVIGGKTAMLSASYSIANIESNSGSKGSANSLNNSMISQDTVTAKTGCTSECETYDLRSGQSKKIGRLNIARSNIHAVVVGGKIHVFGGFGGDKRLRSIERWDEEDSKWLILSCCLPNDLEGYSIAPLSKIEIVILGGKDNGHPSNRIFVFNAAVESIMVLKANLGNPVPFPVKCAVRSSDEIVVFGVQSKNTNNNGNNSQVDRPITMVINMKSGVCESIGGQSMMNQSILDVSWTATLMSRQF